MASDTITKSEDVAEWDSFPMLRPLQHLDRRETFRSVCHFSVVLNDHIAMRSKMAASEDKEPYIDGIKAITIKLLKWADSLPPTIARAGDCLPVVLDIQYVPSL